MILIDMLRKLGLGVNGLYLCAWILALAGLSVSQGWCKDHGNAGHEAVTGYMLLAHEVGDDCKSLYRCAPPPALTRVR